MNIGLHCGRALYLGQLVTHGRLEVTALGDPVNECARIQDSAGDGTILTSKHLLEHLSPDDAGTVGLDPTAMACQRFPELSNVSKRAIRDAGGIPVASI